MHRHDRPPPNASESELNSRVRRALQAVGGAFMVSVLVGFGAYTTQHLGDVTDPVMDGPSSNGPVAGPEDASGRSIPTVAGDPPTEEPVGTMILETQQMPEGDPTTIGAGGDVVTVATTSGTGTIPLNFTRPESSAAPNLPTYVSAICDGESVYSGAFNTTRAGSVVQDVPFSGASCKIRVEVAQPSDRWTGTSSEVVVTRGDAELQAGSPYVHEAEWTTSAVVGHDTFAMDVPEGFTGAVSVKLTACSSRGGTSDETKDLACGDLIQKGVGSEGHITVRDDEQVLARTDFDITAETHHDMVSLDLDEDVDGEDLAITVERTDGSAVLVHGPGSGAVGTH